MYVWIITPYVTIHYYTLEYTKIHYIVVVSKHIDVIAS
jgi:hypothetical protein